MAKTVTYMFGPMQIDSFVFLLSTSIELSFFRFASIRAFG
jgi:hypothetical protein